MLSFANGGRHARVRQLTLKLQAEEATLKKAQEKPDPRSKEPQLQAELRATAAEVRAPASLPAAFAIVHGKV